MQTHFIIFSKDRACQLNLLLNSIYKNVDLLNSKITVIYKTSSEFFNQGYCKIFPIFKHVNFVEENNEPLIGLLRGLIGSQVLPYTCFLVDDDWIIRPITELDREFKLFKSRDSIAALSLRLNPKIDFCQPLQMKVVPEKVRSNGLFTWTTPRNGLESKIRKFFRLPERGGGDWWVKMSVDGNIFRKGPLIECLDQISAVRGIGQLEKAMEDNSISAPFGVCYKKSRLINVPLNRVDESPFSYPHMQDLASEINQRFLDGECISGYDSPSGFEFTSCHVELVPLWQSHML